MRALRVLGIADNGTQVVCQPVADPDDVAPVSAVETFTLPVDERLRAAVRGDLTRIGQLEIEMESQLRPREIQRRIRAGSTVEQVAAAAGCSPERIERYAYPVLLERSTIADRGRLAHPVIDGMPAGRPVEEIVSETLATRGQQAALVWDAFRDERGWALRVTWKVGRSENRATWSYHAGPAGGTVTARDDSALMLIDPAPQPLRTVTAEPRTPTPVVRRTTAAAITPAMDELPEPDGHPAAPPREVVARSEAGSAAGASPVPDSVSAADAHDGDALDEQRRLVADTVTDARSGSRPAAGHDIAGQAMKTGTDGPAATPTTPVNDRPGSGTAGRASGVAGVATPGRGKRGQRPQMPSWEDVLLGTRR